MAYNALNNLIDAYIYANGVQAITGQILNGVLKQMVSQLGSGYHLMGVAGPGTVPEQNDYAMAYFAATAGEYTAFGGITIAVGEVAVLLTYGNGSWSKQTIYNVPTGTADLENTANFITNAVTDLVNYYTKTETDTKLADYYRKTETYDKNEVNSIIATLSRQEYIVAWDGLAAPDVSTIPADVTVTYSGTTYTGTLAASASTVNKIYMVWNGTAYDMYGTSQDGGYSWVFMGTTTVDLSQYATEEELIQANKEIEEINTKLEFQENKFENGTIGEYINTSGVQIGGWQTGYISAYYPVKAGDKVKAYCAVDSDALAIAFYDSDKIFLESGKVIGEGNVSMHLYESTAPEDGYVRCYTDKQRYVTAWDDGFILLEDSIFDKCGAYEEDPLFIRAVTDGEGMLLYGVKKDGSFYFGAGTPPQVTDSIEKEVSKINIAKDEEYDLFVEATIDANEKVVSRRYENGIHEELVGLKTPVVLTDDLRFGSGIPEQFRKYVLEVARTLVSRTYKNPYKNVNFGIATRILSNTHEHIIQQSSLEHVWNKGLRNINSSHYAPSCPIKFGDPDYQAPYQDFTSSSDKTIVTKLSPKRVFSDFIDKDGNSVDVSEIVTIPTAERVNIVGYNYMLHSNYLGSTFGDPGWNGIEGVDPSDTVGWRINNKILTADDLFAGIRANMPFGRVFGTLNHPRDAEELYESVREFVIKSNGLIQAAEVYSSVMAEESHKERFEETYDRLLNDGLQLWCTAVTDWPNVGIENDYGCNLLLLPDNYETLTYEAKQNAILDAYIDGHFFAVGLGTIFPVKIEQDGNIVTYTLNRSASKIYGYFDGRKVELGSDATQVTISLADAFRYVRIKAVAEDGDFVYTNPIFINNF